LQGNEEAKPRNFGCDSSPVVRAWVHDHAICLHFEVTLRTQGNLFSVDEGEPGKPVPLRASTETEQGISGLPLPKQTRPARPATLISPSRLHTRGNAIIASGGWTISLSRIHHHKRTTASVSMNSAVRHNASTTSHCGFESSGSNGKSILLRETPHCSIGTPTFPVSGRHTIVTFRYPSRNSDIRVPKLSSTRSTPKRKEPKLLKLLLYRRAERLFSQDDRSETNLARLTPSVAPTAISNTSPPDLSCLSPISFRPSRFYLTVAPSRIFRLVPA
jgi:hypothetical protein